MMPLYGFLEGDTVGIVVLADPGDTVAELAAKLQQAARVRVAPRAPVTVVYAGRELAPAWTLGQVGIEALDRFDVRFDVVGG